MHELPDSIYITLVIDYEFFYKIFYHCWSSRIYICFFLQASLVILNSTAFSNVNDSLIKIGLSS